MIKLDSTLLNIPDALVAAAETAIKHATIVAFSFSQPEQLFVVYPEDRPEDLLLAYYGRNTQRGGYLGSVNKEIYLASDLQTLETRVLADTIKRLDAALSETEISYRRHIGLSPPLDATRRLTAAAISRGRSILTQNNETDLSDSITL